MYPAISEPVKEVLRCPQCGARLIFEVQSAACETCGTIYRMHGSALDLRLQKPKKVQLEFELETPLLPTGGFDFLPLEANPNPQVDFSSLPVPDHLTRDIISYIPRASHPNSMAFDLGCGAAINRQICEYAGYEYIGLDYYTEGAPFFGDGHALPLADGSIDFIITVSVLEHLRYPHQAMREIGRVLRPGGTLLGTVAFLEPFHGDDFYHFTHLAVFDALQFSGLKVDLVAPDGDYDVLHAQANMSLFQGMPEPLSHGLVAPLRLLSRAWWRAALLLGHQADQHILARNTTGGFVFLGKKE